MAKKIRIRFFLDDQYPDPENIDPERETPPTAKEQQNSIIHILGFLNISDSVA